MKHRMPVLLLLGVLGLFTERSGALGSEWTALRELTQAPTRVVWARQVVGEGDDPLGLSDGFVLMGLDTEDGRGEQVILGRRSSYRKPLLSPDGKTIVFSHALREQMFAVNWDGTGLRRLGKGHAVAMWPDPSTGVTWLYYLEDLDRSDTLDGRPLLRCRLDDAAVNEKVWDRTKVTSDGFQLSRDGTRASGLFPWSRAALLHLGQGLLLERGKGCWTGIAPDNSYRMWVFDRAHRNLIFTQPGIDTVLHVPINAAPGLRGHEVYHPRWSNHPSFFAVTGPYRRKGPYNAVLQGGTEIHVMIGRFDRDFRTVEAWARVSLGPVSDFFPDIWIGGQPSPRLVEPE
jgi:hypothetical protein